ncbi:hypothetical protein P3T76_002631 [Phytophthora citrophthora]|uniref:B box-type domain-containing protein n=1 Tax=Phytophthora citrophthora TaxID=4793 RepID=A0AAD9GWQ7_9STRA|nr:hypothetical protein P3T76_002631 [Phytophthora citrophthora]
MIQDTNTKDEDLISDIRKDTDNDLDSESGGAGDPGVHPNQHQVTRESEATKEFVAPWILSNFPDITSETALQSQAASPDNRRRQCEECCAVYATFECEDCALALCFKCTDAIHIVRTADKS